MRVLFLSNKLIKKGRFQHLLGLNLGLKDSRKTTGWRCDKVFAVKYCLAF